jgi:hypothetical protein
MRTPTILSVIACLAVSAGCVKTTGVAPDKIVYTHVPGNGVTVTSVRTTTNYAGSYCPGQPVPRDSFAEYRLDMDRDGNPDIIIAAIHRDWGRFGSDCGGYHCWCYGYYTTVTPVESSGTVSQLVMAGAYDRKGVDSSVVLNAKSSWIPACAVVKNEPGIENDNFRFKESYVGVRLNERTGWIHLAPSADFGIVVKDFALNLTAYNPIRAGQRE